jgi:tRNA(Arg) A34 adenosine deaminase TadA
MQATTTAVRSSRPRVGLSGSRWSPVANPRWAAEVLAVYSCLPDEESRLRLAVDLARENVLSGTGGPFGAVVVDDLSGQLVAVGVNGVERLRSSLAHAEMVALAEAERRVGWYSLAIEPARYALYASSEPCAMCLGAILWSGIPRVVYAARCEDAEEIGFDEGPRLPDAAEHLRRRGISLERGALREEAVGVLRLYAARGGTIYNGS